MVQQKMLHPAFPGTGESFVFCSPFPFAGSVVGFFRLQKEAGHDGQQHPQQNLLLYRTSLPGRNQRF